MAINNERTNITGAADKAALPVSAPAPALAQAPVQAQAQASASAPAPAQAPEQVQASASAPAPAQVSASAVEETRILLADDDKRIREMLGDYFSPEGFMLDEAANGREALKLFAERNYSLVILDVMMPEVDGWTVCREIRRSSRVPVIMLTARGEEYDKLFGFDLGADDYIVKPFSPKELLARSKAIIRRSAEAALPGTSDADRRESAGTSGTGVREGNDEQEPAGFEGISFEGLRIEFDSRNVLVDGELVSLTPKEYELLSFFAKNRNRVFSREQLLNLVWGYEFGGDDRTVDTHIKMLRESIGSYRKFIVTVWGTGYKFEPGDRR